MRLPRLLALLLVFIALLAFAVWRGMHREDSFGVSEGAGANLPAPPSDPIALDERSEAALHDARETAVAAAVGSKSLRGRVVRGPDAVPVAGVHVLRAQYPQFSVGCASGELPELTSRVSDGEGRFEFDDCNPMLRYGLYTDGGSGWVVKSQVAAQPSDADFVLHVQRLYTVLLRATDEQGEYLTRPVEFSSCVADASLVPCGVQGIAPGELDAFYGAERSYTFVADCDQRRLGPFRVTVSCRGFDSQEFNFWAVQHVAAVEPVEVRLRRNGEVFGAIYLDMQCSCSGRNCYHDFEGQLELERADRSEKDIEFRVGGAHSVFPDVPAGAWRCRVRSNRGGFCYPPESESGVEVQVGGSPGRLIVPIENLGRIRWEVRGPGGGFSNLPVRIRCASPSRAESQRPHFGSNERVCGLEAGVHSFHIEGARVTSVDGASWSASSEGFDLSVAVVAGEQTTVTVRVE